MVSVTLIKRIYAAGIEFQGGPHVSADRVARVFMRLAFYVNEKSYVATGEAVWSPSNVEMAHDLHLHRTVVGQALNAAEVQGLIATVGDRSRGGRRTTWRIILPEALERLPAYAGSSHGDQSPAYETQPPAYEPATARARGHEQPNHHDRKGVVVGRATAAKAAGPPTDGQGQPQADDNPDDVLAKVLAFVPVGEIVDKGKLADAIGKALADGQSAAAVVKAATNPKVPRPVHNWTRLLVWRIGSAHGTVAVEAPTLDDWRNALDRFYDLASARWGYDTEGYNDAFKALNAALVKAIRMPFRGDRDAIDVAGEWADDDRAKGLAIVVDLTAAMERGKGETWTPRPECEECGAHVERVKLLDDRHVCRECARRITTAHAAARKAEIDADIERAQAGGDLL